MKKLVVIAICLGLVYGASAQKGHSVAVYHGSVYGPGIGFGFGYPPFGYFGVPYGGYYPYGYAYHNPSKLQKKEMDIKSDYEDRIYSVHHDDSLTNKQKRQTVRSLKKQRDQEIHDLVQNYHKQPVSQ
jgi:hypothetical protein